MPRFPRMKPTVTNCAGYSVDSGDSDGARKRRKTSVEQIGKKKAMLLP